MQENWRKASRSVNNGACVEVSSDSSVMVRDTTDRDGTVLTFSAVSWGKFIKSL
jgi:hypothetical protein